VPLRPDYSEAFLRVGFAGGAGRVRAALGAAELAEVAGFEAEEAPSVPVFEACSAARRS